MTRRCLVLLAVVSILICVLAGCTPAAPVEKPPVEKPPVEKIQWKFSSNTPLPDQNVFSWSLHWFFDEIEKRSEGRFECNYFWNATLCPAKEQPDGLKSGLMEGASFISAYYPSKVPYYNMGYLPCVFPFYGESKENSLVFINVINEWLQTPPLREEMARWDGLFISEMYPVAYSLIGKVRISSLADLKGVKIRAVGGTADLLAKAGAVIVSVPAPEAYDALNKGIVSTVAHSATGHRTYRFYELSKYWTPQMYLGGILGSLIINEEAYEALPQDIKGIFDEVKREAPSVIVDVFWNDRTKSVNAFKEAGIEFVKFPDEDNDKLHEMGFDIAKTYVEKLEQDGLPAGEAWNSLQDIIAKHIPGYEPTYM